MQVPEKGFYYHYKHDDAKGIEHHAYEVVGIGFHTEDETYLCHYRPLYDGEVYQLLETTGLSPSFDRPLTMWFDTVTVGEKTVHRFQKITDPDTIAKLTKIRDVMYGE